MKNLILIFFLFFVSNAFADNYTYFKGPMLVSSDQAIVTSSATTTITSLSPIVSIFTGTQSENVVLPDTASIANGYEFRIINESTESIYVYDYSLNLVKEIDTLTQSSFHKSSIGWSSVGSGGSGTDGKILVGTEPIIITQDTTTATFSLGTFNLDDLSDVSVSSATDGQILSKSGSNWIATDPSVSAGAGLMLYPYTSTSSVVSTYYDIKYSPQTASESIITATVSAATSPALVRTYLYEQEVNTTTLNGGQWTANIWNYIDLTSGATNLRVVIFKRSSVGVETNLLTIDLPENNSTSNVDQTARAILGTQSINSTDRLGAKIYAVTDSVPTVTVSYTIGNGTHYSTISTPLITRHNDLRGIQGGTTNEYYHLTAAQSASVTSSSGTSNNIAKFTGTNSIGNSQISDDGTTATVTNNLKVGGTFSVTGTSTIPLTGYLKGGSLPVLPTDTVTSAIQKIENNIVASSASITMAIKFAPTMTNNTTSAGGFLLWGSGFFTTLRGSSTMFTDNYSNGKIYVNTNAFVCISATVLDGAQSASYSAYLYDSTNTVIGRNISIANANEETPISVCGFVPTGGYARIWMNQNNETIDYSSITISGIGI